MEFPTEKFEIIYADPCWKYKCTETHCEGKSTGGASTHYNVMDLGALKKLPVKNIRSENCLLYMWATGPLLDEAIELGQSWGFKFLTMAFVWNKNITMVGHYTLSSCEYVLLFKHGTAPKPRGTRNERQYLLETRSKRHSEKPSEIRDRITRMHPTQKKIELFSRHLVDGWSCWGNDPDILSNDK